jgi:hypothetical protein
MNPSLAAYVVHFDLIWSCSIAMPTLTPPTLLKFLTALHPLKHLPLPILTYTHIITVRHSSFISHSTNRPRNHLPRLMQLPPQLPPPMRHLNRIMQFNKIARALQIRIFVSMIFRGAVCLGAGRRAGGD